MLKGLTDGWEGEESLEFASKAEGRDGWAEDSSL